MKKIKLGVIGLGFIGKTHVRNSLKLTDASLEAVSDVSKMALRYAKKDGARKTYTDYNQLLKDPDIDAVIIGLPTHLHLDCALKAAEAKKHILLEKPVATNVSDAEKILSAARKNSVKLMVGYYLRFNSIMCDLREKINSGELGDPVSAYATNISTGPFMHRAQGYAPVPVPKWWFNKEMTGGGALIDLGCHMINLLRWFFGEITDIKGWFGYRFNMDFEDHAVCLAQFDSGPTALINVGWFSQKYQLKVEVHGTVGHAIANNIPPNPVKAALQMLTMNNSAFWQPYLSELTYFVNCVTHDIRPSPSGEDGVRDLIAIEAAYKNSLQMKNNPCSSISKELKLFYTISNKRLNYGKKDAKLRHSFGSFTKRT